MATRQAVLAGTAGPIFVNETGTRQAILPGVFLDQTVRITPVTPTVEPTSGPTGKKRHWRYIEDEEERYRRYLARLARELPTVAVPDRTRRFAAIVRRMETPEAAAAYAAAKAAAEELRTAIALQARAAAQAALWAEREQQRGMGLSMALAAAAALAEEDDVATLLLLH